MDLPLEAIGPKGVQLLLEGDHTSIFVPENSVRVGGGGPENFFYSQRAVQTPFRSNWTQGGPIASQGGLYQYF